VQPPCLQQFLGADDAERVEQLGSDDVLSPLAAGQRQVCDAGVVTARRSRPERRIFIIGMGTGMEDACCRLQSSENVREPGCAGIVDWPNLRVGSRCGNNYPGSAGDDTRGY